MRPAMAFPDLDRRPAAGQRAARDRAGTRPGRYGAGRAGVRRSGLRHGSADRLKEPIVRVALFLTVFPALRPRPDGWTRFSSTSSLTTRAGGTPPIVILIDVDYNQLLHGLPDVVLVPPAGIFTTSISSHPASHELCDLDGPSWLPATMTRGSDPGTADRLRASDPAGGGVLPAARAAYCSRWQLPAER